MRFDGTTPAEREAMQRQLDLAAARQHTGSLRRSTQPRWERLRSRLELAGIRLEDAAVASKNTEDRALEFGLLVARDGRAFSFEFDSLGDDEGRDISPEDARVTSWEELDQGRMEIYRREIDIGRELLERGAPTG